LAERNSIVPFIHFNALWRSLEMARRDELSLETMLADPIVRDLMAADGVDSGELELQLRMVRDALARRGSTHSGNYLAQLVKRFGCTTRTNRHFPLESILGQEPQCAVLTGTRSAGAQS
jgi:hypothetical protein